MRSCKVYLGTILFICCTIFRCRGLAFVNVRESQAIIVTSHLDNILFRDRRLASSIITNKLPNKLPEEGNSTKKLPNKLPEEGDRIHGNKTKRKNRLSVNGAIDSLSVMLNSQQNKKDHNKTENDQRKMKELGK
ncbi:Hypothetical predicted protein [Mytilus galloprovincialis]|uniref:Uncharacterized protein n=1 Tax=Mytilus galloprovincialis TaxID=29158 RepID=A0A8B6HMQ5_MYTGA|nr:Hypothetical predicted protein [Mytilus galloprovincialis]